jgi:mannosyl-3-phosphoglycerate phosphatase
LSEGRDLLVATDLDGCLLDASYSYEAARPALAALARDFVPLVLVSSKTRAEIEPLVRVLGLDTPFVVENGGALVVPRALLPRGERVEAEDGPYAEIPLGTPRRLLVEALHELSARVGVKVRGFAGLTSLDLERLTGLSSASAARALQRHYDEPFLVEGGDDVAERLASAAVRRGFVVSRGGQFHHLTGRVGKGDALRRLLDLYGLARRRFHTVALGDAANDLSMLEQSDRPIVVPRPNGSLEPSLASGLPRAERAPAPGPAGWNEAVLAVLRGERLPSVAA